MLKTAILGGAAGAVVSVVLPMLLGAARQRVPRWFGFVRIAYVRTVAVTVFGVAITTGINLSTSDHSHRPLSYIVWYGVAAIALIAALAATIVIDRRLARDADSVPPTQAAVNPRNATMNRFIRRAFHEHKGRRSVIEALSPAERERILRESGERAAREIHDPTLRALDKDNEAAAKAERASTGTRAGRREAQGRELLWRLAELRVNAMTLSFSIGPAIEFNDLLAESERWAGSSDDAPRAVITTPTGGRLTLPSDWFTDADFARLKAYLEEHMRRLQG
ncbi:MAG TPA: hypothetical protein VGL54_00110 [Solirubrobacteraceae bacterium]|jgi:hypothetical protein